MKIQPINYSTNLFRNYSSKKEEPKEPVSFNARISINTNVNAIKGESANRFNAVMKRFLEKIETRNPSELGTIAIEKPQKYNLVETKYGPERANLVVQKSLHSVPFFYNIKSSIEEISDDLLKTYEYILQLEDSLKPRIESDSRSDFNSYYFSHMP